MNIRCSDRFGALLRVSASLLSAGTLAACVTSHVLIGHVRPATWPAEVQIYLRPPAGYEEIALIESSSRGSFALTAQQKTDKVVDRLKNEAAALGANGILLQGVADENIGAGGVSFGTATAAGKTTNLLLGNVSGNIFAKGASAIAIYIPPRAPNRP